jgi:hypothetical protein
MYALLQKDSGFSLGAVGVVVILVVALVVFLFPFFDWIPGVIYRLIKRRKRPDDSSPPPLPRQHGSHHDDKTS